MPNFVECALNGLGMKEQFKPYFNKEGVYKGTYLQSGQGHGECNRSLAADTVWRYAHLAMMTWEPLQRTEAWDHWVQFASLVEFVQTMSQATQHPKAAFWWPRHKLAFYNP